MADQFSSAPFIYPQGSFYQDLDNRLQSLEAILGTGVGQLPDGAVSEFKLADDAVTTRSLKDAQVTGPKLKAGASSALADTDSLLARSTSGLLLSTTLTQFVSAVFTSNRKISNATFLAPSLRLDRGDGICAIFDNNSMAANRTVKLPNRNVNIGDVWPTFVSANQSITPGALLTLPHGLTIKPQFITVYAVCITTYAGWTAGQELVLNTTGDHIGSAGAYGYAAWSDDTNVYLRIGANNIAAMLVQPTSGTASTPVIANHALRVVATL